MAYISYLYSQFPAKLANKELDLNSDALKVMLCSSLYVPSTANHAYASDITNEVTGTGYTTGGGLLTGVSVLTSGTTTTLDASDIVWSNSTITARYAILYDSTPATAATQPLILYIDFGGDQASSAGGFSIQWDSAGILAFAS